MTREELIKHLVELAKSMFHHYSWETYCKIWDMANQWNAEHEERDEIFVCELSKADGDVENGIWIEDDYFYFLEDENIVYAHIY